MYGFGDASKYWYLRVKEELINLGGNTSSTDPGIFYWKENNELIDISICHVDNIVYRGTTKFENSVNQKLKQIFKFGCEDSEVFTYLGTELQQNDDYSIIISQNSYIDTIKEIILDKEQIKQVKDQLTEIERKDYRRALGQLNWVSGISQPNISFYVCDASTKFQNATITDALKVNKVIKHLKSTKSFIKVPKFDKESLKVVSATFLLVCCVCLKESTCETRKNAFYFILKALLILKIINF